MIWLSTALGEDYVDPHNLGSLMALITAFVSDEGPAVILLDGLEYLIFNNDFPRILHFLENVIEQVAMKRAILLLSVDDRAFGPEELALIERNTVALEPEPPPTVFEVRVMIVPTTDAAFPECERLRKELGLVIGLVDDSPQTLDQKVANAAMHNVPYTILVAHDAAETDTYRVVGEDQEETEMHLAQIKDVLGLAPGVRSEHPEPLATQPAKRSKAKVCLVGDQGAEKAALIRRYVLDEFDDMYLRTQGAKVSKKEVSVRDPESGGEVLLDLTIWDILGEKRFLGQFQEAFFHGTRGLLAVCDATRKQTLEDLHTWIEGVYRATGSIPTVLVANKADRRDQVQITEEDLEVASAPYGGQWYFTSAKTSENVERAFQTLAQLIVASRSRGSAESA